MQFFKYTLPLTALILLGACQQQPPLNAYQARPMLAPRAPQALSFQRFSDGVSVNFKRIGKLNLQMDLNAQAVTVEVDYDIHFEAQDEIYQRRVAFRYGLQDKEVRWVDNRGGDTQNWDYVKQECQALMRLKIKL